MPKTNCSAMGAELVEAMTPDLLESTGPMPLVVIHGPPASGKLTVARLLSRLTKLKLFHNHLTVDLLLQMFDFGSPAFVTLREQIWLSVILEACTANITGLIFTFTPERTVSTGFLNRLSDHAKCAGADVRLVELVCPEDEIEQRLARSSRKEFAKLRSVEEYRKLRAEGAFTVPATLTSDLVIDTSVVSPKVSAACIANMLKVRPRLSNKESD